MHTYPDVSIVGPNYALWLFLIIPAVLAVGFLASEYAIEHWTEKRRNKPVVGIGYVLMGISLFAAAMAIPLVPDAIYAQRTAAAIEVMEKVGFEDVRLNIDAKTFGAYYEGELMRGVLVERPGHPGIYQIVETTNQEK